MSFMRCGKRFFFRKVISSSKTVSGQMPDTVYKKVLANLMQVGYSYEYKEKANIS